MSFKQLRSGWLLKATSSGVTVTALAWTSNERLIFADGATIKSVQLSGHQRTLVTLPAASGGVACM